MRSPALVKFAALAMFATASTVAIDAPAPTRRAELDHVGAYNFKVEISGVAAGFFKNATGLSGTIQVIEFQDGDDLFLKAAPKSQTVVFRAGVLPNNALQELVGKHKRDLVIPIVHRKNVQKLAHRNLCTYRLDGAKVLSVKSRRIKVGEETATVKDVTMSVDGQSHNCGKYFKHPSKR